MEECFQDLPNNGMELLEVACDSSVEVNQSENAGNNANSSKGFDYLMVPNVIPD